jgi:hypothetical protein
MNSFLAPVMRRASIFPLIAACAALAATPSLTFLKTILSCGAGFLDILMGTDGDHFGPALKIPTRKGACTCLFAFGESLLFLAVPEHGSEAA